MRSWANFRRVGTFLH